MVKDEINKHPLEREASTGQVKWLSLGDYSFHKIAQQQLPQKVAGTENTLFLSSSCFIITGHSVSIKGAV